MQVKVPLPLLQYEDKIIGPLTLKQFILLLVGLGLGATIFFSFPASFQIVGFIIAIPVVVIFFFVAFGKINDRPMDVYALAFLASLSRPRLRVFKRETFVEELMAETQKQQVAAVEKDELSQERLDELAELMDTRGKQGAAVHPTFGAGDVITPHLPKPFAPKPLHPEKPVPEIPPPPTPVTEQIEEPKVMAPEPITIAEPPPKPPEKEKVPVPIEIQIEAPEKVVAPPSIYGEPIPGVPSIQEKIVEQEPKVAAAIKEAEKVIKPPKKVEKVIAKLKPQIIAHPVQVKKELGLKNDNYRDILEMAYSYVHKQEEEEKESAVLQTPGL